MGFYLGHRGGRLDTNGWTSSHRSGWTRILGFEDALKYTQQIERTLLNFLQLQQTNRADQQCLVTGLEARTLDLGRTSPLKRD